MDRSRLEKSDESNGASPNAPEAAFPNQQYVKLNVGGYKYYTSKATLLKQQSMLASMFSGRMNVFRDSEGYVMIDRDGKHFNTILNYLRDNDVELPDSLRELRELQREVKFYCLEALSRRIDSAIQLQQSSCLTSQTRATTNIMLVNQASQAEADAIVRSGVPVVKLTMNRHNNKYSYTANSFDLLLKNSELFESLALRFPDKVKFIKDIWGQSSNPENGICTWTFYFKGQPIGDLEEYRNTDETGAAGESSGDQATPIVCHSIFYGNEKKQTKVDFLENKVYERFIKMFSQLINEEQRRKQEAAAMELRRRLADAAEEEAR